jgi:HEAT repeat protein
MELDQVILQLKSNNPKIRNSALEELYIIDETKSLALLNEQDVTPLRECLLDADQHIRWRAAYVLGVSKVRTLSVISSLTQALEDISPLVRLYAAHALLNLDVDATLLITLNKVANAILTNQKIDLDLAVLAAGVMLRIDNTNNFALNTLLESAKASKNIVREDAITYLSYSTTNQDLIVEELIKMFSSTDTSLCDRIITCLSEIATPKAVEALMQIISNVDVHVFNTNHAINSLLSIDNSASRSALVSLSKSDLPSVTTSLIRIALRKQA